MFEVKYLSQLALAEFSQLVGYLQVAKEIKLGVLLPNGAKGTVLQQKGAWFLLQTDEYVGWIHGNTIKVDNENSSVNSSTTKKSANHSESRTYIRGSHGGGGVIISIQTVRKRM